MTNAYITILGTGNALATRCYNTYFTLHAPSGEVLLVDAGGGNGILTQLERAEIDLRSIHHHLPHAHGTLQWHKPSFLAASSCRMIWRESLYDIYGNRTTDR